jgi:hypothetical protein
VLGVVPMSSAEVVTVVPRWLSRRTADVRSRIATASPASARHHPSTLHNGSWNWWAALPGYFSVSEGGWGKQSASQRIRTYSFLLYDLLSALRTATV